MSEQSSGPSDAEGVHKDLLALRREFDQATPPVQRVLARTRRYISSATAVISCMVFILVWVAWNIHLDRKAFDPSPFAVLNIVVSAGALLATLLVLAGQRREDEAEKLIARLTLHLAAESEEKMAKLIQLLEEQRRDSPAMPDRPDPEAERMSSPASPQAMVERLQQDRRT